LQQQQQQQLRLNSFYFCKTHFFFNGMAFVLEEASSHLRLLLSTHFLIGTLLIGADQIICDNKRVGQ